MDNGNRKKRKKVLVWETLSTVSGGQKMTLTVMDLLGNDFEFCCLIPEEGKLSDELTKRKIKYIKMGSQSLPTGVKGKKVIFKYGVMSLKNIWKSSMAIIKFKPDVLYAPGPAALPWSAVCGTIFRKPVIWHLHHIFLDGPTMKLLNVCGKWKSVKKIIAVSNCVGNQITSTSAHNKVEVLYNPVNVEKYETGNGEKAKFEIEKVLNRKINWVGQLVVVQIGAITKNKCQDFFVEVISALKKYNPNVLGILLGDAHTDYDKKFKNELICKIHEKNITENICMMGNKKNINDYLSITDCVLIPSQEGLSLVALEAMCAKKRIVAINKYGTKEILNLALCGELYEENASADNVAEKILNSKCLQNKDSLSRGKIFCKSLSEERFTEGISNIFSC